MGWEQDLDRWLTTPPEDNEVVFCLCEHCEGEIYVGEEYTKTDEGNVHEDCFVDFAREVLGAYTDTAEEEEDYGDY